MEDQQIEVKGSEVGTTGVEVVVLDANKEPVKAFRGNVNMDRFDDREDAEPSTVFHGNPSFIKPMPMARTNEEIDRLYAYNKMMGRCGGMGYIFG